MITMQASSCPPVHLSHRNGSSSSHKTLSLNVPGSFVHNSPTGTTQISFDRRRLQRRYLRTMEHYSVIKKNKLLTHAMSMKQGDEKKPISEDYILRWFHLYNILYITFWKWQNYQNREWISGCQGLEEGRGGKGMRFGPTRHEGCLWRWNCFDLVP